MGVIEIVWNFFQNEILGMKWLYRFISTILNSCGLDITSRIGGSIQFFIYDTIKIMILLGVLILFISYIQSFFPPERTKKILGQYHGIYANILAALLGTVTPFCSCSSIPLFIGFTSAGLPLGVTFSFLISSPMVDLGSLVLLMSIFGGKVAVIYVILGLVIAVVGGTLIEAFHLENYVEEYIWHGRSLDVPQEELHFKDRLQYSWDQVVTTAKKVAPYVLVGVGIGAIIHNWIPEEFIVKILGDNNPFGVVFATVAGVPMYADIFGTIP
ncbi:MAG: permease, partial [Erysipelotrichaceae bacterium]|nr:permease [Erysipelotrichaceae bacterium]